jgi:hypothetical protein
VKEKRNGELGIGQKNKVLIQTATKKLKKFLIKFHIDEFRI